ncbi:hypothetical protein BJY01DRAFT_263954 [Aspergillus pseudoustus]|uniref:FAD linked oxidase N-terminal domain-containing protein n=1 Tax=Aspergillus pseudoustus TaxID=1810923 RepID=A0ABR4JWW5_9EURO
MSYTYSLRNCCAALLNTPLAPYLVLSSSPRYPVLVNAHYATSARVHPDCFFQPQSSEQVGLGVSTLAEADDVSPECQFAIRGGGHAPWKGAAGAEGGVTIDLALMNATVYSPDNSSVTIMGGARSGDVYKTLQRYGVAVTGGRSDTVGVGGLIIGGGLSYFGNKYGLACNNVVLSNGQTITASHTSYPDLFRALKGGGNSLGIVTNVELRAFKQGPLWGGLIVHGTADLSQQNSALVYLTSNLTNDPHAPASPNIPHTFSALRSTDIYDLMMETVPPPGKKAFFLTLTFGNDARLLERLCNFHNESVDAVTPLVESDDWNFITFLQPFPAVLANASAKKVKVLGLDHILYLLFLAWQSPSDDALFHEIGYNLIGKPKAYSEEIGAGSDFVYMNYARREQNLLSGYGEENFQHLVAMVEKYDPIGVFQTQCPGGWKMSAA